MNNLFIYNLRTLARLGLIKTESFNKLNYNLTHYNQTKIDILFSIHSTGLSFINKGTNNIIGKNPYLQLYILLPTLIEDLIKKRTLLNIQMSL